MNNKKQLDFQTIAVDFDGTLCYSKWPELGQPNQALQGQQMDQMAALDDAAARFLQTAAARLAWSARGTHRALKVARTIADLSGSEHITVAHVAEAMQYRRVLRTTV